MALLCPHSVSRTCVIASEVKQSTWTARSAELVWCQSALTSNSPALLQNSRTLQHYLSLSHAPARKCMNCLNPLILFTLR